MDEVITDQAERIKDALSKNNNILNSIKYKLSNGECINPFRVELSKIKKLGIDDNEKLTMMHTEDSESN